MEAGRRGHRDDLVSRGRCGLPHQDQRRAAGELDEEAATKAPRRTAAAWIGGTSSSSSGASDISGPTRMPCRPAAVQVGRGRMRVARSVFRRRGLRAARAASASPRGPRVQGRRDVDDPPRRGRGRDGRQGGELQAGREGALRVPAELEAVDAEVGFGAEDAAVAVEGDDDDGEVSSAVLAQEVVVEAKLAGHEGSAAEVSSRTTTRPRRLGSGRAGPASRGTVRSRSSPVAWPDRRVGQEPARRAAVARAGCGLRTACTRRSAPRAPRAGARGAGAHASWTVSTRKARDRRVGVTGDPVAEVEDVGLARRPAATTARALRSTSAGGPSSANGSRLPCTTRSRPTTSIARSSSIDQSTPSDVGRGLARERQQVGVAAGEVDQQDAELAARRRTGGRCAGKDVLAVVVEGERAGPAVEHLQRVDAGLDLAAQVVDQQVGEPVHQMSEGPGSQNMSDLTCSNSRLVLPSTR